MVEPVDAVVERSEPGEVEVEGKVAIKFSISDVRGAKVSRSFVIATVHNIIARFLNPQSGSSAYAAPASSIGPHILSQDE